MRKKSKPNPTNQLDNFVEDRLEEDKKAKITLKEKRSTKVREKEQKMRQKHG